MNAPRITELEYKPDFETAVGRWDDFWQGNNETPLIQMIVPKKGIEAVSPPPYLAGCFDNSFDKVLDRVLAWAESHEFLGDALPHYVLEFGPDHFAALLGADLQYAPDMGTSWAVPFVKDWNCIDLTLNKDHVWWRKTVEYARMARDKLDGKVLICPPTILANLDALAAIRGTTELLTDLATTPEILARVLDRVCDLHDELLNEYATLFDFASYGCINRFGAYLPTGKMSRPQCDLSCMISPEMVDQFLIPSLRREVAVMDHAMYHLDGPEAIRHLEAVCSIDKIDMIQFVPGAGNERRDWTWLFDKIDALGKG
ncbi:MAG: hypothetical protein GF344_14315, partial [Chitinivibrionales bacterium]|nr:hypothetical protein [Chitinivibrionales bacterium]